MSEICEVCGKQVDITHYMYSHYCTDLQYKACTNCMSAQELPYWGLLGLLVGEELQIIPTLTEEQKRHILSQIEKMQVTKEQLNQDFEKAKNIWTKNQEVKV